ncbi:MAG: response regulator [Rubripirellula sp.]
MNAPNTRVLIADDNVALATVVAERFESHGLSSVVCSDGDQAWDLFRASSISVIVSDFDMPGISGTELCRRVHSLSPQLPFFIMTAREVELQSDPKLRDLKVARIFPKPFRFAELLASVKKSILNP